MNVPTLLPVFVLFIWLVNQVQETMSPILGVGLPTSNYQMLIILQMLGHGQTEGNSSSELLDVCV